MTKGEDLPLEVWNASWEYIKEKMVEYHMNPAEVLHLMMNYNTRTNDYGEILREVRKDMAELDYPKEVAEHLVQEQVGEFVEFDNWMWAKKIDKKYEPVIDFLLKQKIEPDEALKILAKKDNDNSKWQQAQKKVSKHMEENGINTEDVHKLLADVRAARSDEDFTEHNPETPTVEEVKKRFYPDKENSNE